MAPILAFFWRAGGIGLLILGILDSSFLFAPLGNDILLVGLTARHPTVPHLVYYAGMSTAGSLLGCLLVDAIFRKAGEKGLEKHLPKRRLDYVKRKVQKNAAWTLAVSALAPPPFPFTPFVMASSALQYSRARMLLVVGAFRMIRFAGLGVLAFYFGRRILRWAEIPGVQIALAALVALCIAGSVISVFSWIRRSRRAENRNAAAETRTA